jgi:dephospho-CoA kinase
MKIFGLTGGIACGKSTVASFFSEWGVPIVDADRIARQIVSPNSPVFSAVLAEFGEEMRLSDGTLNRSALGSIVFADERRRAQLNAIVHPAVRSEVNSQFAQLKAQGHLLACYDIPLLFETGQVEEYRPVVVVSADDELRLVRIQSRDGLDRALALARLSAQLPLAQKVALADFVIENNGTLDELRSAARATLTRVESWVA